MVRTEESHKSQVFDQTDNLLPAGPGEPVLPLDHDRDFEHSDLLKSIFLTLPTPLFGQDDPLPPVFLFQRDRQLFSWSARSASRTVSAHPVPAPRLQTQSTAPPIYGA